MVHKVREMTVRLIVDDDGPVLDSIGEVLIEGDYPDWLLSFEAVREEQRDATEDEAGSMCWDVEE